MASSLPSSWNETDSTFHVSPDDQIELHKEVLRFIFCSTWLGVLSTVALAFLTLSTASQRRAPLFALQAMGFALAIIYNTCEIVYSLRRFEAAFRKSDSDGGASYDYLIRLKVLDLTLEHVVPILCDAALLIKVHSFFPYPIYSRRKQILVLGPLLILMIPRIGLTIVASYAVWRMETDVEMVPGQSYPVDMGYKWVPLVQQANQAEFAIQAGYCLYAAGVLLRKAIQFTLGYSNPLSRLSLRRRMRFFFEAMLMTFIPPIAFASAAAGTIACDSDHYCYFREMSGTLLNTSVLFGLLATTWSSIRARHSSSAADDMVFRSPSQLHGMTLPRSFLAQTFPSTELKSDSEKAFRSDDDFGGRGQRIHPYKTHHKTEVIGTMHRTSSGFFDFDGKLESGSRTDSNKTYSEEREDIRTILDADPKELLAKERQLQRNASKASKRRSAARQEIIQSGDSATRRIRLKRNSRNNRQSHTGESNEALAERGSHVAPSRPPQSAVPLLQQVWSECEIGAPRRTSEHSSASRQSVLLRPAIFDSSDDDEEDPFPASSAATRRLSRHEFESAQQHALHSLDEVAIRHRRDGSSSSCPVHGMAPISASSVQFNTPPAMTADGHCLFHQQQQQYIRSPLDTPTRPPRSDRNHLRRYNQ